MMMKRAMNSTRTDRSRDTPPIFTGLIHLRRNLTGGSVIFQMTTKNVSQNFLGFHPGLMAVTKSMMTRAHRMKKHS